MKANSYYVGDRGADYYTQRRTLRSESVQRERAALFIDISDTDSIVLDFGCGNGMLLAALPAAKRIGVEIGPEASRDASQRLDAVFRDIGDVGDQTVDVVISYHALEHLEDPVQVIRGMWRVLKPDGRVRIVVPCGVPLLNSAYRSWAPNDSNMHLYEWAPLTLGNLLTLCGFGVESAELVPGSGGGRLGRRLSEGSAFRHWLRWLKALRSGRFFTVVTARKPLAG